MSDHWSVEEYRRFIETGREPESERQRKIEEAWAKAEREGRVMVLDIPVERTEQEEKPTKLDVVRHTNCPVDPRISELQGKPNLSSVQAYSVPKRKKYGNQVTYVDGIRFDSKHEAEIYQELMIRVKAGELKCVCRQVHFDLGGGPHAQKESRYEYVADFVTLDNQYVAEVIDAKSDITRKNPTYINKKKAMLALWDIRIKEM